LCFIGKTNCDVKKISTYIVGTPSIGNIISDQAPQFVEGGVAGRGGRYRFLDTKSISNIDEAEIGCYCKVTEVR
jgi:hypothetical protein